MRSLLALGSTEHLRCTCLALGLLLAQPARTLFAACCCMLPDLRTRAIRGVVQRVGSADRAAFLVRLARLMRAVVQVSIVLTFLHACAGELLPLPVRQGSVLYQNWPLQQVALLIALSSLIVLLGCSGGGCIPNWMPNASWTLAALNVLPVLATLLATGFDAASNNCPPSEWAVDEGCDYAARLMDVVGQLTARIARLDLGLSMLLIGRDPAWLLRASGGHLGYAEAVPIHRTAGWWCAGQSALHSVAYLLFYLQVDGWAGLWHYCFPTVAYLSDSTSINSLGLVNFFGVVAFIALIPLAIPAWPPLRRRVYQVFQRLHVAGAAVFVLCCAMHDLPILLFAVPGLAAWYVEWRGRAGGGRCCSPHRLHATAKLLPGTSWVELTIADGAGIGLSSREAPRGQWVSLRVPALSRESHPLSLSMPASRSPRELSVLVSAASGDWSRELAEISQSGSFEVEIAGPYPCGGGIWSLSGRGGCEPPREPSLLLLAGGTGVAGWLQALATARAAGRPCHLVWCVRSEADYRSLEERLPLTGCAVTVFITRQRPSPLSPPPSPPPSAAAEAPRTLLASDGRGKGTRKPHRRSAHTALESLAAALTALAVGYWGWRYLVDALGLTSGWAHATLAGYTAARRCFPIVLVAASMVGTMAAGRLAAAAAAGMAASRRGCSTHPCDTEVGALSPRQEPQGPYPGAVLQTAHPEALLEDAQGHPTHTVHVGRPSLDLLVRAAAAQAETRHLAVAACGPAVLVAAAERAVAAARKELRGVRLDFSGTDPRW